MDAPQGNHMSEITIESLGAAHRVWANRLLTESWGSIYTITTSGLHDTSTLPGFVALHDGRPCGLLTYRIEGGECEIVTLNSLLEGQGVGSALIDAATQRARAAGCTRLWLITTNDNTHAISFYQKRGFVLAALHANILEEWRRIKPQIPLTGFDDIPLRDALELEMRL
jgi:ribosomal protein S18 acetylase RimI-like enzyme